MRTGSTIADPPVPVKLCDEEMLARAHTLAEKINLRTQLVAAKLAANQRAQGEINEVDTEIARLGRVILAGFEDRAQMELFADSKLAKDDAARKLAEIAARAAKHPFVADAERIDTCAREGCGAQAGADVHVAPPPAEPHTFAPDGSGEGKCWACGSGKVDAVHAEPVAAAWTPHAFVREPNGPPDACEVCGGPQDGPVHAAGIETANTPTNETAEVAASVDCSRCGKNISKAEVLYDSGVKPVCETCKRAGIEAGTWPHAFDVPEGVGVPSRTTRCRHCKGRKDDAVHDVPPEQAHDPAYDFTEQEPPPKVIASARAIDDPKDAADDGEVGGEAGA